MTPDIDTRHASKTHGRAFDRWVMGLLLLVTLARSIAVIASPLELGVDEAQYWAWSQIPDFGYFTKPPLIAWIIGLSHALFGHEVWAVRLPACWLHFLTSLVLWRTARWMGGAQAGRWAAIIWIGLPIIAVGSFVISTDTPLLLALSTALLAIIGVIHGRLDAARGMFFGGVAVGVGVLAKYAALYFLVGVALWIIWERLTRDDNHLTIGQLMLFVLGIVIAASPNVIWNLTHDFTTVRHLGDNANITRQSYDFAKIGGFMLDQLGVAGPGIFVLMLGILRPPFATNQKRLMICLSLPVLGLMAVQAFISEANANWAVAAYPALTLWLACWLVQTKHWRWGLFANSINTAIALIVIGTSITGNLGSMAPASDPLHRLRGWHALASDIRSALTTHNARLLVADRRATAALMGWHFHGEDITITVYDADGIPSNHYEQNHAFETAKTGTRRLIAVDSRPQPPNLPQVNWQAQPVMSEHAIAANRTRKLFLYAGTQMPQ